MTVIKILVGLVVLMSVTFFLLGLKSQKGVAKGLVDGRLADCGSAPNCASSELETQPEKRVQPLSATLTQARDAVIATGGTITSESDSYISATYMSKLYKFVDDVELRDAGDGTVHIRSASRVGYSDRGVNKTRIALIREALNEPLN